MFRRNETTNECIDYVEFRLSNGKRTQKYCGIVTTGYSMDRRFEDSSRYNSWGLGAVKSEKEVEVFIFISKEPLQEGESVELEIAFTFYAGESLLLLRDNEISRLQYCDTMDFFAVHVIHYTIVCYRLLA